MLLNFIGEDGYSVYENFTTDEQTTYAKVTKAFEDFYAPKMNRTLERHKFFTREQNLGESIDDYVNELKTRSRDCEFGTLRDSLIADRIVCGIRETKVRERLLREKKLELQTAIDIVKTSELATAELRKMMINRSESADNNKIDEIKKTRHLKCRYCGREHEFKKRLCPAYGKECSTCNRPNHFAVCCRDNIIQQRGQYSYKKDNTNSNHQRGQSSNFNKFQNNKRNVNEITSSDYCGKDETLFSDSDDEFYIGCIEMPVTKSCREWRKNIIVENMVMSFKVDTGAQVSVLSKADLMKIQDNCGAKIPCKVSNVKLSAFGGSVIPTIGKCFLNCTMGNSPIHECEFYIVEIDSTPILGITACDKLNLIPCIDSLNVVQNKQNAEVLKFENICDMNDLKNHVFDIYADSFEGLGHIDGLYKIKLSDEARPVINPPRRVPFAMKLKVKQELDRMIEMNVIKKVDEPTDWVNSIVVTERNGKFRMCLDPNNLNKFVLREHCALPVAEEVLSELNGAQYFTKLDAKDGFWHISLDEESSYLTTFGTPFGRYRYLRLPFGLKSSNEIFQKRMSATFGDITGVIVIYDDLLIYGKTMIEHNKTLQKVLDRARNVGVKWNKKKCVFGTDTVKYIGHIICREGIKPDPSKIADLINMPNPIDKLGVHRVLGVINYLSKFIPNASNLTEPLRILLNKNVEFSWDHEQEACLKQIKAILTSEPVLGHFDPEQTVTLCTDSSRSGMGACLMQTKPIAYASRSLNETQVNYAQIEKELLSIVFGCERFYQYIWGKRTIVETDHKPLVSIFKKSLHSAPPRIQRLLLRLQRYDLEVIFKPGKLMFIPDTLSRAYVACKDVDDKSLEHEMEVHVHTLVANIPISSDMKNQFKISTMNDEVMQNLRNCILYGWPDNKSDLALSLQPYWNFREELHVAEGLVFKTDRVVVPSDLREEMLTRIHSGHQGQERCKLRARQSLYWPGMNNDIVQFVEKCEPCLMYTRSRKREPLQPHAVPDAPWQKIAVDVFQCAGKSYQLVVDYFSKFVELGTLSVNPTADCIIKHLKDVFSRYGLPNIVISDGASIYKCKKLDDFARVYEFEHVISSARNAQSNGQVERMIQTIKKGLMKAITDGSDLNLVLLAYRSTPISSELKSPAEILFNRKLRNKVPDFKLDDLNKAKYKNVNNLLNNRQNIQKFYYDRRSGHERPPFKSGDFVKYKEKVDDKSWEDAQILNRRNQNGRSYELINQHGNTISRNKRLLVKDETDRHQQTVVPDTWPVIPDSTVDHTEQEVKADVSTEPPDSNGKTVEPRRSQRTRVQTDFYRSIPF